MLALLRLLDMGSGWDDQLVALSGRKAREVTQFGVLGLFITGRALDAALMRGFTTFSVFSFFGVDGTEERPLAGDLPITISQPGVRGILPDCRYVSSGVSIVNLSAGLKCALQREFL